MHVVMAAPVLLNTSEKIVEIALGEYLHLIVISTRFDEENNSYFQDQIMAVIPLSQLSEGAEAHIESIIPNPVFGELDALVSRRLADLGFSDGVPLLVIAKGVMGNGPFAVRLGNQSQFALREPEADKIMCRTLN